MGKKHIGLLVGSIIPGVIALILAIGGTVCRVMGPIFLNHPEDATIKINGRVLHGKESVEAALKAGEILVSVGGGLLIVASVLALICLILLILYFVKRDKA